MTLEQAIFYGFIIAAPACIVWAAAEAVYRRIKARSVKNGE